MKTLRSIILGYGARVCDPQRTGLQGGVLRLTEPRSTFAADSSKVAPAVNSLS
jgi:hypothetical protein